MSVTGTDINLTLRQVKGSELTYAELDGNQSNLKTAIESHSHDEFASSNHNHLGVYQQVMGADDNYVTDTEKAALHAHTNKTALDNVSGINTGDQDLSGYSLTTHNHTLSGLSEKSYNSLTDKPTIPSITGLLNEASHDVLDHTGLTGILALGTTGTTACAGNDTRLSDARTPLAHTTSSHSDWPAAVSMAEVGYLDGVTSSVQTQLNEKESALNKGQALGYCPLDSSAKVAEAYLPDSVLGQVEYQGVWNATTNTPTIPAASAANKNWYYIVSVSGTTTIDGVSEWTIGDWIISNGVSWNKIDNTDSVSSVFGRAGAIVANAGDYTASQVTNVPAGNIAATTVQAAINELDTEKASATDGRFVTNGDNHDHVGGDGAAISLTSAVTGILPVANGGTGSSTQNFVDLTSNQTIGGVKTFTSDMQVNGGVSSTGLNVSGNVRIGESTMLGPNNRFAVGNAAAADGGMYLRNNGTVDLQFSFIATGKNTRAIAVTTGNLFSIGDPDHNPNQVNITSSGNLLIGTTTDDGINKLQVNGNIKATGNIKVGANSTAAAGVLFNNATWGMGFVSVAAATNAFGWFDHNVTPLMALSSTGNLLVGTTTDRNNTPFVVEKSSSGWCALFRNSPSAAGVYIGSDSTEYARISSINSDFSAYKALALNPSGGNVLIGTTTDDGVNKLQVNGSVKFSGSIHSASAFWLKTQSTSSYTGVYFEEGNYADFWIGSQSRCRVSSTGLSVTGTISATALPTSDPHVAGAFWRSGNTVMVSTG